MVLCCVAFRVFVRVPVFFIAVAASTEIYALSLHDALPISVVPTLVFDHGCEEIQLSASSPSVDRKSTRLNSSHVAISYAVFCLKKKTQKMIDGIDNGYDKEQYILHPDGQAKQIRCDRLTPQ